MLNVLKQSGAKVTGSFKKRFNLSLAWLTLLYGLTLAVILLVSGTVTYSEFSSRIGRRFGGFPPPPQIRQQIINMQPTAAEVRQDLIESLIFVNSLLLVLASISSYWLARRTLQPIRDSYERQQLFLSDASHELRTPLSILHIELENELSSTTKSAERERITSKLDEVKRMSKIVNDLLTLSRLDAGKLDYTENITTVHLEECVSKIVKRLQPLAESNGLTLSYIQESQDIVLTLDEDVFSHALTNFIQNAIVYNKPGGKVNVITKIKGKEFLVEIIDTGIGISPDDLNNIFERFYRTDKSRSRKTGGSGLGLSIAQSAIRHIGGRFEIESKLDEGTKVKVFLPLK